MNPKLRAWWFHRQGLDGSLRDVTPAQVLQQSGWARSVGGAAPYLTFFARARCSRAAVDAAVAAVEICELPSARGCTYVLPATDFAMGLRVGGSAGDAEFKQATTLGVTETEINALCVAVIESLSQGPLDPTAIRRAVGPAARTLGEAGKKKGISTTLPLALGRLQASGDIRRVPQNGRLDQQRYAYARWVPNPLAAYRKSPPGALGELAERFFDWVGPATLGEFQWFAGISGKAALDATRQLDLVPCEPGSERLLLRSDLKAFTAFRVPGKAQYALVSSLDAISAARRDVRGLLDDADLAPGASGEASLLPLGRISDLPSHAILDRGRLIGLWEFDPDAGEIAYSTFTRTDDKLFQACVMATQEFVRDDLGDARAFSLDTPASRAPRIAALRRAQPSNR